ncbi:hypothetical protein EGM97_07230 [Pseudomonas sp. AF32]|nr:hypothetical protein [Pseudomonas sp. AF32]
MTSVAEFEMVLDRYVVDKNKMLYQFDGSPVLSMAKGIDSNGDGGFGFAVHGRELTNWRLFFNTPEHAGANPRALYVIVRSWKVYAVKVWMFEKYKEGGRPVNSYRGKLTCNITLGDALIDLFSCVELEFDSEEEWYVAKGIYGGLEVSGYGESLEDNPDQVVMALTVLVE